MKLAYEEEMLNLYLARVGRYIYEVDGIEIMKKEPKSKNPEKS